MRIDAVAASGVTTKTIRFYEQVGLLPAPPRTSVTALIDRHLEDIERRLDELRATRAVLHGLAERAAATDPA